DFLIGPPCPYLEVAAILQRQEIGQRPLHQPQPMRRQIEVADDFGIEERDRVSGGRVAEAGKKLFRHGRTADDSAPLKHDHAQARPGQIGRAHEAVMAAADDRYIAGRGHSWLPSPASAPLPKFVIYAGTL